MKKSLLVSLCAALALLLLAACGTALPDGMSKEDIDARAEEIATALVERDYEKFVSMMHLPDEASQAAVTPETMADYYDTVLDELGAFQSYKATSGGYKDTEGNHYGVVLIEQSFENGSMNHTVTFDKDSNLIGFIRTPSL